MGDKRPYILSDLPGLFRVAEKKETFRGTDCRNGGWSGPPGSGNVFGGAEGLSSPDEDSPVSRHDFAPGGKAVG